MKLQKPPESRLLKRVKAPVTAREAVKDLISQPAPESRGLPLDNTGAVIKKEPTKRLVSRTFRLQPDQIRSLTRIRDKYNAARADNTPAISLDEIARLMSELFLEQEKPHEVIDRLRGLK